MSPSPPDFVFEERGFQSSHIYADLFDVPLVSKNDGSGRYTAFSRAIAGPARLRFPPCRRSFGHKQNPDVVRLAERQETILEELIWKMLRMIEPGCFDISIHHALTLSTDKTIGEPVPQHRGLHQDRFDWHGFFLCELENSSAAVTTLSKSNNVKDSVFQKRLIPGNILVFSDNNLWHYTSELTPDISHVTARRANLIISLRRMGRMKYQLFSLLHTTKRC